MTTTTTRTNRTNIGDLRELIRLDSALAWPPDVFAFAAILLQKSGAYTKVVEPSWPPAGTAAGSKRSARTAANRDRWATEIRTLGMAWRKAAAEKEAAPPQIRAWLHQLQEQSEMPLDRINSSPAIYRTLLQTCAAADEACAGVGLPGHRAAAATLDRFDIEATQLLRTRQTLCRSVDNAVVRVLPKLHTPQVGLTLRSLTHHLALCPSGDILPEWHKYPSSSSHQRSLNLLLVPWPPTISPRDFAPVPVPPAYNMDPRKFGFFTFDPNRRTSEVVNYIVRLFDAATEQVDQVHAVILPEGALGPDQHQKLRTQITTKRGAMLIAGVTERSTKDGLVAGKNYCTFDTATVPTGTPQHQQKHHRWRVDKPQILQYGLGGSLDPEKIWWEHVGVQQRRVRFVSIYDWLTMCVLICEDLARQDPVAELVRAVGPNLVVALLMDGPQLLKRWSSRYAMVLADDPGSSVLTLTSLGMATLCRPPNEKKTSRCIALWKDAKTGGPYEIELPSDKEAAVLSLAVEEHVESSADGRTDATSDGRGGTGYPILAGIHFVARGSQPRRKN